MVGGVFRLSLPSPSGQWTMVGGEFRPSLPPPGGTTPRAIPVLELLRRSAEALVAAAPQLSFSLGPVLFPHPSQRALSRTR